MKYLFLLTVIAFVFFSCSHQEKFPTKITHFVSDEMIQFDETVFDKSVRKESDSITANKNFDILNELSAVVIDYEERNEDFNFQELKVLWEQCKKDIQTENLEYPNAKKWIAATGLLLETTADAKFANELQFLLNKSESQNVRKMAADYVFTKNVDNLHVNLFFPAEINFAHTLDGDVTIKQETNYPETGKTELHFNMTKRRYIELFIRIPEWTKDAQVTVKGVKYVAPPGGYCKIAKKWREGDLVEIFFPGIQNANVF